jgi:hypothetical protein
VKYKNYNTETTVSDVAVISTLLATQKAAHNILSFDLDAKYDILQHNVALSAHTALRIRRGPSRQSDLHVRYDHMASQHVCNAVSYHVPTAVYTFSPITRELQPNSFAPSSGHSKHKC